MGGISMTASILTLAGGLSLVAVMLAVVIIAARLPLAVKVLATAATAGLVPLTLHAVADLRGMPTDAPPPRAFKLHWARVLEPNPLMGEPGKVYLWLEELDALNFPMGTPRAYALPYDPDLVRKVEAAMTQIAQGEEVSGTISDEPTSDGQTAEDLAEEATEDGAKVGAPTGEPGSRFYGFDPSDLTFGEALAPITPAKE